MRPRKLSLAFLGRVLPVLALAVIVAVVPVALGGADRPRAHRGSPDPLRGIRLYVDPASFAARQVAIWRAAGDTADAALLWRIAAQPTAKWLADAGSAGSTDRLVSAAQRAGSVRLLVLYDIPNRDCHGYSSGGAANAAAYLELVRQVSAGIAGRPAIVLLEPDAIDHAESGCISVAEAKVRYGLLRSAVAILKSQPRVHVYLDAGNPGWLPAERMVGPLLRAGVRSADGFAVNVANFQTTTASIAYGRLLSRRLGGSHFVIDTSRNGSGPPAAVSGTAQWCNPPGRSLGRAPSTDTHVPLLDAYLWVKYPGASDGECHPGDPAAGVWWPDYALALARGRR
jgi:endoglucanase